MSCCETECQQNSIRTQAKGGMKNTHGIYDNKIQLCS